MDLTESEKIVKDVLEKQGYIDYKIITHNTTVGTNVTTAITKKNDSEIVLTIAEGIKQIIGNKEIVTHTIFIEESLPISMSTPSDIVTLTFDLEQSIPIGGRVTNRNDEILWRYLSEGRSKIPPEIFGDDFILILDEKTKQIFANGYPINTCGCELLESLK